MAEQKQPVVSKRDKASKVGRRGLGQHGQSHTSDRTNSKRIGYEGSQQIAGEVYVGRFNREAGRSCIHAAASMTAAGQKAEIASRTRCNRRRKSTNG
jgi:hypothetical protein